MSLPIRFGQIISSVKINLKGCPAVSSEGELPTYGKYGAFASRNLNQPITSFNFRNKKFTGRLYVMHTHGKDELVPFSPSMTKALSTMSDSDKEMFFAEAKAIQKEYLRLYLLG